MKRELLAIGILAATMSCGAQAALKLEAFGGFVRSTDSNFADSALDNTGDGGVSYYGCGANGAASGSPLCTSISWGTPTGNGGPFAGESGAAINYLAAGDELTPPGLDALFVEVDPNTLGEVFVLGSLTHFNEPITGDPDPGPGGDDGFVGNVDVEYDFTITHTGTSDSVNFAEIFPLVFFETLNQEPCDDTANLAGSICDDTFQFFGEELIDFKLAGVDYTIEIIGFCTGTALGTCTDPGILYSAEGETSTGYVLEIKQVPAPGALVLISAGLIGLGFARRRQTKV